MISESIFVLLQSLMAACTEAGLGHVRMNETVPPDLMLGEGIQLSSGNRVCEKACHHFYIQRSQYVDFPKSLTGD